MPAFHFILTNCFLLPCLLNAHSTFVCLTNALSKQGLYWGLAPLASAYATVLSNIFGFLHIFNARHGVSQAYCNHLAIDGRSPSQPVHTWSALLDLPTTLANTLNYAAHSFNKTNSH